MSQSGLLRRLGEQLGLFDEASAPAAPPIPVPPALTGQAHQQTPSRALQIGAQRVPYELTRAQRRTIGFAVGPDGLKVRAPRWVSMGDIERALLERGDWILRQLQRQQQRQAQQASLRVQWGEGASLPYLGAPLRVERGPSQRLLPAEAELPARLQLRLPEPAGEAQWRDATQAWLQAQARALFQQRLAYFAEQLGINVPKLRLSSARGRWGSASSSGVVSLNWRLMHFSEALIDYVVAHEVAHLREMNHGPRFWALVGELLPGFEDRRDALKHAALPEL
jgi:predicted metal-dependent hydrolase